MLSCLYPFYPVIFYGNYIDFTHKATLPKLQTNKNKILCKKNLNVLKYGTYSVTFLYQKEINMKP